jgi:hypothetical protein
MPFGSFEGWVVQEIGVDKAMLFFWCRVIVVCATVRRVVMVVVAPFSLVIDGQYVMYISYENTGNLQSDLRTRVREGSR